MESLKVTLALRPLGGSLQIPSSKSLGHRELICGALAEGVTVVEDLSVSQDIEATCRALRALGVAIESTEGSDESRRTYRIEGPGQLNLQEPVIDVGESGSTLRFLVPLCLLGEPVTILGRGRLISRPLEAYYRIFEDQAIQYSADGGRLPLKICGRLKPGLFRIPGDVSSQFVSGLLFALPRLSGDSLIEVTSDLESRGYVDLTLACLKKYGVTVQNRGYRQFYVAGNQTFKAQRSSVEGDYSQAAFWLVAGLLGSKVTCGGMNLRSLQGDRQILAILERMGARLTVSEPQGTVRAEACPTYGTEIDGSQCPDLVPVLAALASVSQGTTRIFNAQRLRFKESDRLAAIASELKVLGADLEEQPDGLLVRGKEHLSGGKVQSWNDHRIAMSLAVISSRCASPLEIAGAQSVNKSYPGFWRDFQSLGGEIVKQEHSYE